MIDQDRDPTTQIHKDLLKKTTRQRSVVGYNVQAIEKTGSKLHILTDPTGKEIIWNAELPASSMAVWQFLDSYTSDLLHPEQAVQVFGKDQKPHVARIIKKGEQPHINYHKESANTFGEYEGLDTLKLVQLWDIQEEITPYTNSFSGPRWIDSTIYFLVKDFYKDNPSLDPNNDLQNLLTAYWAELKALNQKNILGILPSIRDVEQGEIFEKDIFAASTKLLDLGRQVTAVAVAQYHALKSRPDAATLEWRGKSLEKYLLVLIHFLQTSNQEKILWWLGVAHGHPHFQNTVSRVAPSSEDQLASPLETTFIDFDRAKLSPEKLVANPELYQMVDAKKIKADVIDSSKNPHLRFVCLFYLPLSEWDSEVIQFVEQYPTNETISLLKLIAGRAPQENLTPEQYTWFIEFIARRGIEDSTQDKYVLNSLIIKMINVRPELFQPKTTEMNELQKYCAHPENLMTLAPTLSKTGKALILTAIEVLREPHWDATISVEELSFLISLSTSPGELQSTAKHMLSNVMKNGRGTVFVKFFEMAEQGNADVQNLISKTLHFYLEQPNDGFGNLEVTNLLKKLYPTHKASLLLKLMDWPSIPTKKRRKMYATLYFILNDGYFLSGVNNVNPLEPSAKETEIARFLKELKQSATGSVSRLYILQQDISARIEKERIKRRQSA